MSGETEANVSGWTTDTLKEFLDLKAAHLAEMANARAAHAADLRQADQEALQLALQNTKEHFERLNENAARTIEERAHFVANEVFNPFRDQVNEALTLARGRQAGVGHSLGVIVSAVAFSATVIGIIVVLANVLTKG